MDNCDYSMTYEGCKDEEGLIIRPTPRPTPGGDCDCDKIEQDIADLQDEVAGKQNTLTAGTNITIENDVISAAGTTYTAGTNIDITNDVISAPNVYNKTEVNQLIDAIETGQFVIVEELPATGENKTIYLLPKSTTGYTEWLYINGAWEEIGDTDVDLSNYYTKTQTDALLDEKQDALTAGDYITIAQDGTISANYTKADILTLLGYSDQTISKTDSTGKTVTMHILGYIEESGVEWSTVAYDTNVSAVFASELDAAKAKVLVQEHPGTEIDWSIFTTYRLTLKNISIDGSPCPDVDVIINTLPEEVYACRWIWENADITVSAELQLVITEMIFDYACEEYVDIEGLQMSFVAPLSRVGQQISIGECKLEGGVE